MLYTNEIKALAELDRTRACEGKYRRILKKLSNTFGFDYNRHFVSATVRGKFTARSMTAILDTLTNGETENYIVALMFFVPGSIWINGDTFTIAYGKFIADPIAFSGYRCHGETTGHFWRLQEINDLRKDPDTVTYVIAQEKSMLRPKYEYPQPDLFTRYDTKRSWPGTFVLKSRNDIEARYQRQYVCVRDGDLHNDTLDKSGYAVGMKRIDLIERAKKLKAERQKSAYQETDCTAMLNDYKRKLQESAALLKSHVDAYLDRVIAGNIPGVIEDEELCRKFHDAASIMGGWFGVSYSVKAYNRAFVNDAGKTFASLDDLKRSLSDIDRLSEKTLAIDPPQESDRAAD